MFLQLGRTEMLSDEIQCYQLTAISANVLGSVFVDAFHYILLHILILLYVSNGHSILSL